MKKKTRLFLDNLFTTTGTLAFVVIGLGTDSVLLKILCIAMAAINLFGLYTNANRGKDE